MRRRFGHYEVAKRSLARITGPLIALLLLMFCMQAIPAIGSNTADVFTALEPQRFLFAQAPTRGPEAPDANAADVIRRLAGRWQGVSSRGDRFVWSIHEDGRAEALFQTGRRIVHKIWMTSQGSIAWSSETGSTGSITLDTDSSGAELLRLTIRDQGTTVEARRIDTSSPTAGAKGDSSQKLRSATSSDGNLELIQCKTPGFSEVLIEVRPSVDLGDDATVRRILDSGAAFSRDRCAALNINVFISQWGNRYQTNCVSGGLGAFCVVRGLHYSGEWNVVWNGVHEGRLAEEREKEANEARRISQDKEKAEQDRIRRSQEEYAAVLQREKQSQRARFNDFARKHGVQEWTRGDVLVANPFMFQGKKIGLIAQFEQMMTETEALFSTGGRHPILLVGIPKGYFTVPGSCVIVGSVTGRTDVKVPVLGTVSAPRLTFVGAHVCRSSNCRDLVPVD